MEGTTSERKEWHFLFDMLKTRTRDTIDFVELIREVSTKTQ